MYDHRISKEPADKIRVCVSGVTGSPRPSTTRLAVFNTEDTKQNSYTMPLAMLPPRNGTC